MATNKKTRIVVADEQPEYADDFTYADDLPHHQAADQEAGLCPQCGELLAWHEQACVAAAAPQPPVLEEEASVMEVAPATSRPTGYAYALGGLVQPPLSTQPHAITWRGQLKERQPDSGLVRRVNVYRLDNGYWDCYHEEELQVA